MLTKEQLSELICKHSERENGLQDLLEILLESMMVSERREYLRENSASGNKCNGFRPGHSYGHGRTLTFRIPRDRYGNFHPRILAILRHQEDECERLAGKNKKTLCPVLTESTKCPYSSRSLEHDFPLFSCFLSASSL